MKRLTKNTIDVLLLLFVVLLSGCKEEDITNISAETLIIDPSSVTLYPPSAEETRDSVQQLTATITPANAGNRAVIWKSSGPRIASVNDEGVVKAHRPGAVTITAIAYSNTEIRDEIPVIVEGIPDDVVSGVAGTYTGTLDIPGVREAPNTELTLAQDPGNFYAVRLITSVDLSTFPPVGAVVPINILTGVDRSGSSYTISGEGTVSPIGKVKVEGTVDADGNINLSIEIPAFNATATYSGKNVANIEEIVTGTYVGDVAAGAPVGSNVEVVIKREDNKYKLQINDTIAGYLFQTELGINVSRSGDNYTIYSSAGTASLSNPDGTGSPIPTQATITSGTITTAGNLTFDIDIPALANFGVPTTARYTGQKLENLAKAVAGTYKGVVKAGGQEISAPNAEITLTAVDRTTVKWTTFTTVNLSTEYGGSQTFEITENHNFELNVSGGSGTYTLTGSGNTSLGPITVSPGSVENKNISLTMMSGLPMPIVYIGDKQ
jgi:hypothetical protein